VDQRGINGWSDLTLLELAAAKFVCDGLDDTDLADRLGLPADRAREVLERLFAKVGVASRVDLVIQAVGRGALA
jgi:DNA-binding CsgD family transcriptional regulator